MISGAREATMSLKPTSRPARAAHGFQSGRESRPHGTGQKLSKSQTTEILTTLVIMGLTGVNHNWTAAENALLGKLPDPDVARRIGLTPLSIFRRRTKLGIPAYKPPIPKPRKKLAVRRAKSKPWTSAEVSLLGTDTDRAIGARLGLTREAVQRERRLRKIPTISDKLGHHRGSAV
jgi:hypothetical protein